MYATTTKHFDLLFFSSVDLPNDINAICSNSVGPAPILYFCASAMGDGIVVEQSSLS